jgi:hypothetical protein
MTIGELGQVYYLNVVVFGFNPVSLNTASK